MRSPHISNRWRGRRVVIRSIKLYCSRHKQAQVARRESNRAKKRYGAHHKPGYGGEERYDIEAINWMPLTHTPAYRWRGVRESKSAISSVCAHQHQLQAGEEKKRVLEPIKCMRSPHTSYRWRGERVIEPIKCMRSPHPQLPGGERESHRANQVYALTTHQLQVERRESHRANQVDALNTHQLQVERRESHRANQVYAAHHTPATGGEERDQGANQVDAAHHTPS